jgi:hypothetical protein
LLPWLGGLCLISYLGDYPEKSVGAGNTATLTYGPDFLVILALTLLVYVLALMVRLPKEQVEENIEATKAEAAEEERELGAVP